MIKTMSAASITEAGVAFADDVLCHAREYAKVRDVVRDALGRDVAANRTYVGENHALLLRPSLS